MLIQILGAVILALLFVTVFGRGFVPWLVKHGMIQPLKKEVEEKVYSEEDDHSA